MKPLQGDQFESLTRDAGSAELEKTPWSDSLKHPHGQPDILSHRGADSGEKIKFICKSSSTLTLE